MLVQEVGYVVLVKPLMTQGIQEVLNWVGMAEKNMFFLKILT